MNLSSVRWWWHNHQALPPALCYVWSWSVLTRTTDLLKTEKKIRSDKKPFGSCLFTLNEIWYRTFSKIWDMISLEVKCKWSPTWQQHLLLYDCSKRAGRRELLMMELCLLSTRQYVTRHSVKLRGWASGQNSPASFSFNSLKFMIFFSLVFL